MSVEGTLTSISLDSEEINIDTPAMQLPSGVAVSPVLLRQWLSAKRATVKPWTTFIKTSNFKSPLTLTRWSARLARNIEYFQSNYLFVSIILILYCLLTSPLLLLVLVSLCGAQYLVTLRAAEHPLVLGGRPVPLYHQYMAVSALFGPVFWLAGAGTALLWVVAASAVTVAGHASFYAIESLVGDQEAPFDMEEVCVA